MSRIGKKPILIPESVEVTIEEDGLVKVKGPKGELSLKLVPEIQIEKKKDQLIVFPQKETKKSKAFWGLYRTLIANNIVGVTKGYQKQLEIEGLGYKAELKGKNLVLHVGFSHPVEIAPPEGIEFQVEGKTITVSGIDKQLVGQVAADIRAVRPPEPYKGKGIRYVGEVIRKKVGKKAVGAEGA
jgi:large subunit ribosomal protein L6